MHINKRKHIYIYINLPKVLKTAQKRDFILSSSKLLSSLLITNHDVSIKWNCWKVFWRIISLNEAC